MPIGAFFAAPKGQSSWAIRLISIDPSATKWVGKFAYESFFQPDRPGSLMAKNVVRQTAN
jgi:hypothetical protein